MAQLETTGGGVSYTPDGKKLTKQVYVLTAGETTVQPAPVAGSIVTAADFTQSEAGLTRVTVTWSGGQDIGGGGGGGSESNGIGATTELIGGAREVPIESHPTFKPLTDDQLKEIKRAIAADEDPDTALVPTSPGNRARVLYKLLLRGTEYYLAPAVSYRETTLETQLPTLRSLCTVSVPLKSPAVNEKQNWLLSSVNARSVSQLTGGVAYEVTREWMLSDRNGWDPEKVIYNGS